MCSVAFDANEPIPLPTRSDMPVFTDIDHPMVEVLSRELLSPGLPSFGCKLSVEHVRLHELHLAPLFDLSEALPGDEIVRKLMRAKAANELAATRREIYGINPFVLVRQRAKRRLERALGLKRHAFPRGPADKVQWFVAEYLMLLLLRPEQVWTPDGGIVLFEDIYLGMEDSK